MFYYFGHSYPVGPSKLAPVFDKQDIGSLAENDFEWVLNQIFTKNISKVYGILDTCHSGILSPTLDRFNSKIYCMMAAENGYTKGTFSKHLLKGLASVDDDVRSLMHDNQAGGLTLNSLFQYALEQSRSELEFGIPQDIGSLGTTLIRKGERGVPSALRKSAPERTTYRRLYFILQILSGGASDMDALMLGVQGIDAFVLNYNNGEKASFISVSTIQGYIKFLSGIGFLETHRAPYKLTKIGKEACSVYYFNIHVVEAILEKLFPEEVDLDEFKRIIWELLRVGSPADPFNVSRCLRGKGFALTCEPKNFKFAFKVLAYSGVFRRSREALFPIGSHAFDSAS